MSIWATSNSALQDIGQPVIKSSAWVVPLKYVGLKPSSQYDFYVNNINMNWACKPFGKRLSSSLISDEFGGMSFDFFTETMYQNGYALSTTSPTLNSVLTCELRPTSGGKSTFLYIPITLRASQ